MKTITDRLHEVAKLYKQLDALGLTPEVHHGIAEFRERANAYVRTGTKETGNIPLSGTKRLLQYSFEDSPTNPCTIVLKYNESYL